MPGFGGVFRTGGLQGADGVTRYELGRSSALCAAVGSAHWPMWGLRYRGTPSARGARAMPGITRQALPVPSPLSSGLAWVVWSPCRVADLGNGKRGDGLRLRPARSCQEKTERDSGPAQMWMLSLPSKVAGIFFQFIFFALRGHEFPFDNFPKPNFKKLIIFAETSQADVHFCLAWPYL